MRIVGNVPAFVKKHQTFILIIAFGVFLALGSAIYNQHRSAKKAEDFAQQQASSKARLEKTLYDARAKENKQRELADAKYKGLLENLNLTQKSDLPDCSKLKNRPGIILTTGNCDYRLAARGSINMAVVFMTQSPNTYTYNQIPQYKGPANSQNSFEYINTYLQNQELSYIKPADIKIQMTYFGPYSTNENMPGDNSNLTDSQAIADLLNKTSKANNVPEDKYDLVSYAYIPEFYSGGFRSFALPAAHRGYTSLNSSGYTPVFVHETLHLFGASDKYNNNDCNTRGKGDPFNPGASDKLDIMCWSYGNFDNININAITAREIGWKN